jgi:hypothetical protein
MTARAAVRPPKFDPRTRTRFLTTALLSIPPTVSTEPNPRLGSNVLTSPDPGGPLMLTDVELTTTGALPGIDDSLRWRASGPQDAQTNSPAWTRCFARHLPTSTPVSSSPVWLHPLGRRVRR